MASKKLITTQSYDVLVADLRQFLQKGQADALKAANKIKVTTYWKMGQRMDRLKALDHPEAAKGLMQRLSEDLGLNLLVVYRILQFYRMWPKKIPQPDSKTQLSWTHYVELLAVKDPKGRHYYLKEAVKNKWGAGTLRTAVQKDLYSTSREGNDSTSKTLKRSQKAHHIYKARVEKVVDGDTLSVTIDLGFHVGVGQRIRFRGVNTAELVKDTGATTSINSSRALQAKAFVEEKLKGLPFIVIRTYKTDLYGRYVADIFYHPTHKDKEKVYEKGFFLNAQLLKSGLADLV
jgi:endonuclease YncB( thermonuclease family)